MATVFDQSEAARFELALERGGVASPTLFPLLASSGLPAIPWGSLAPGEAVASDDPLAGYGIATGERSGGLVCLDVDTKGGVDGFATLATLETRLGPLPETLSVESPSGGVHLYFTHPARFQSNAGKLGAGLDVRGEGGYVRIPGTPHPTLPGVYRVDVDAAPAMLPPAWADRLPRAGDTTAPPIPADPLDESAADLRERLRETSKGRRGAIWSAWRKIADGERFVRVRGGSIGPALPDGFGGVDEFITKGLIASLAVEGEWYRVTPDAFLTLIAPSLSILQADDASAGNPVYSDADVASKWGRTTEWARRQIAERERNDALADRLRDFTAESEALPWLVVQAGCCYIRTPGLAPAAPEYVGPVVRAGVWTTARDEWRDAGPDVYKPGKHGPVRMGFDDLLERYGRAVSTVAHALHEDTPRLDERERALVLPGPPIRALAIEHPDVERWLASYDPHGHLHDWIAIVTDLEHAAPALWLTGAGGIGKSLLAAGLGRIWGASPTPMARAFAEFNDSILACPLVEGEEEVPRGRDGRPDVEALKRLITETRRKINEKHKPVRDVLGSVRVIMSSNNTNLIRTAADLTAEDAQALADRFVHVHVPPSRARTIQATLPTDGEIQREWIDGGKIAEHALWIAKTRNVPFGSRLRMEAHSERLRRMLVTQPGAGFLVCQAIYDWIIRGARSVRSSGEPVRDVEIQWHAGTVCATASAILHRLPDDSKRHSRKQIGQTLRRFATGQVSIRVGDAPKRFWAVDLENIRVWADEEGWGDVEELDAAAKTLNGEIG